MGQICDLLQARLGDARQPPMVGQMVGRQACFKCQGKGFCHDSSMSHDKGPFERCFFCKDCNACCGSGAIPGGATVVTPAAGMGMGVPLGGPTVVQTQGLQPCFKCDGRGFVHESTMTHDKAPSEKCFFCQSCNACGGSGAIQGGITTVTPMVPAMGMGMGMGGMGMGGMGGAAVVQSQGLQACFKCDGRGFCHDSTMTHDKAPDERCFFCKPCNGCGGSGAIEGGTCTVAPMCMPGMGMPGMMGGVVVQHTGPQPCFKCDGKGFCHDSSMTHNKGSDERCFFCSDCSGCGGSGAIH